MQPHHTTAPARVHRTCEVCGASFLAWRSAVRRGHGRFCGKQCQAVGSRKSNEDRFWAKVDRTAAPDGCWPWLGYRLPKGYGLSHRPKPDGGHIYAHRLSWELHFGPIPGGLVVCHRCDNPPCVRPDHLFLGTARDNSQDMAAKGRQVFQRHPERAPRGSRNGQTNLTEADVLAIRTVYAEGNITQRALAQKYGIGKTTVGQIVRHQHWQHV